MRLPSSILLLAVLSLSMVFTILIRMYLGSLFIGISSSWYPSDLDACIPHLWDLFGNDATFNCYYLTGVGFLSLWDSDDS